jgi:hypothetical protein
MRPSLRIPAVLALAATTGCLPLPGGHSLASKTVIGKSADALLAGDGTSCRTSPRVVQETPIGAPHQCLWISEADGKHGVNTAGAIVPGDKVKRPAVPPKPPGETYAAPRPKKSR